MKPVAAGTLPADLIDAIRGGAVTLNRINDEIVVFRDARRGVEWHCTRHAGRLCSYRHQKTGANGKAEISRFDAVKRMTAQPEEKSPPNTSVTEETNPPPLTEASRRTATLSEVMQQHRSMAMKVAHLLAPAPRDQRELRRSFAAEDGDALNAVLSTLTVLNHRGQRELLDVGYEIIDIEHYNSKAVKQQVANLALPKVAHNKAVLDRFAIYADRDVMLAVCSKGIMAGLGSFKRKREEEDDSEDAEGDEGTLGRKAEETAQGAALTLFTHMDQCGIRWCDGDLTERRWVLSSAAKEALAQRKCAHTAVGSGASQRLKPMPIINASQLAAAHGNYVVLHKEYHSLHDLLKRVEEITEAARGWYQSNATRISEELHQEMQRWFAAQEGPWRTLIALFDVLHKALYELKREIEDYVNLREWGVLT
ncbi:hypothetical protein TcG_05487 [Trypanosoma cruzi]|nr:hypothetical protein TcG_05487 [Trypanosoma cruzi]